MKKSTLGAIQIVLAATCWSVAGVFTKSLPWGGMTVFGLRALFAMLFLLPPRIVNGLHFTKANLLGALGVAGTGILFINATKLTSAANAIVIQYAAPVIVIAINWFMFHQRPTKLRLITAAIIFIGVMLCSMGGGESSHLSGDLLAVLSAVTWALVFACSQMNGANASEYTFIGMMMSAPFAAFAFFDPNMTMNTTHWLSIAVMALCLASGYFFLTLGMKNTSAISAALLSNLEPVLNPLWVFLFLGEAPGVWSIVGAFVVIGSTASYAVLENRAGGKA